MPPNQARELILARFETSWAATTLFVYENEVFQPPDDEPWLRLSVRHNRGEQESLSGPDGIRSFVRGGLINAEIRVPPDIGLSRADELGHQFRTLFEATAFSGVRCSNAIYQEFGSNGKWFVVTVDVIFEYDERK